MGWGDVPRCMPTAESMTAGWAMAEAFTAAEVVFGGALAFFAGFKMMEASRKVGGASQGAAS